ncbi:MAG: sensor histidine kinase [Candidatus Binatia bacterium]
MSAHLAFAIESGERTKDLSQLLSRHLLRAQEEERQRIARELHDEIGQALTALKMELQAARRNPLEVIRHLEGGMSLVDQVLSQVRTLLVDLRPAQLDSLGLVPTLRWYVNRQAQRTAMAIELFIDPQLERFPADIELACFRIAQEALTNVFRHAQAQSVQIELQMAHRALSLRVCDDGVGFDVGATQKRAQTGGCWGMVGMHERARLVGGTLSITSKRQRGTEIRVIFPLEVGKTQNMNLKSLGKLSA